MTRQLASTDMIKILESPREGRIRAKRMAGQEMAYPPNERTTELLTMLRTMRPAGSGAEYEFVEQWVKPLGTEGDGYGNQWLVIGESPILWSCHTDTVHKRGGAQYVGYADGCAYVTRSNCLGSDDTTGVWIMRHMIKARVPGTYVFHRAEEVGGLGSQWIADNTPERLAGIQFAIAFDRKGYGDIITDQMGNTASDDFAYSLSKALHPLPYSAADGVFTDTQVYSGIIPECSNLSVGYHAMHTSGEWQDVDFANRLLDQMITADFSGLESARNPDDESTKAWWLDDTSALRDSYGGEDFGAWRRGAGVATLDQLCREHPDVVADFLESCGYDLDDLKNYGGID
jgi:hypothetical protein